LGGFGSGPRVRSERELVENCLTIDINQLIRNGAVDGRARVLTWEHKGREVASAHYSLSGGKVVVMMVCTDRTSGCRDFELQVVETTAMPCNYGGQKWFLICPGHVRELEEMGVYNILGDGGGCDRPVSKLYRPPGGRQFLCRHCLNLTYLSTRVSADMRMARRAMAVRKRLGQRDPGQPFPAKPKHMHLKTYNRLRAECMAYETAGTWLTLELFGLVDPCMLASPEGKCNLTTEVVRQ